MAKKKTNKQQLKVSQEPIDLPIELYGFLTLASAAIIFLSLLSFSYHDESQNWIGLLGDHIGWIFHVLFGLTSYAIALFIAWLGFRLLVNKPINRLKLKVFFVTLFAVSLGMLLNVVEDIYPIIGTSLSKIFYTNQWTHHQRFHLGGALQFFVYKDLDTFNLSRLIGVPGVTILFASLLLASSFFLFKISFYNVLSSIINFFSKLKIERRAKEELEDKEEIKQKNSQLKAKDESCQSEKKEESDFLRYVKLRIPSFNTSQNDTKDSQPLNPSSELLEINPEKNLTQRPSVSRKEKNEFSTIPAPLTLPLSKDVLEDFTEEPVPFIEKARPQLDNKLSKRDSSLKAQSIHNGDFTHYSLPSSNLLTSAKKVDQSTLKKDLKKQAEVLEETLLSFGIEAKVGQINCGPTITSFEVHPSIGVKVQRIKSLENDIALNMEAKSIRIIAPIPGKAAVGIEVPNPQPQEVSFKDMLQAYQQSGKKFHIPVLLGKAVNGDYVMSDLTKMPHCIIAGATGSGKSVCINTIVMSIVLNAKPDQIKLVMVDPKKVELTPYAKLPHMLAPVITEPHGACAALRWMVKEMEKRYEILKQIGVRNIDSFNNRAPNKEFETSLNIEIPEKMPYIVGIIDELADLMMVASSDIETPIARIAQMARAVGIHLVLATQRPSREVITGLIKANFPTRISFKVASRVNSQIILDETGAESLLGNGDMLFLPPGTSHLVRAQGAFIRDEDINLVIKNICDQAPPNYVIESFDHLGSISIEDSSDSNSFGSSAVSSGDAYYDQALDIILSTGNASTTFLQRKLKIGYARAASLMDELESKGVVGPAEGSKPRKILATKQGSLKANESDFEDAEI